MIRIPGRGAVYGEVWYDEVPPRDGSIDIVEYRKRGTPVPGAASAPFLTLVSDLTESEDAMQARFGKDCRYKIRRADSKDGLAFEFDLDPQARLAEFVAFYDRFVAQRGAPACEPAWLAAACESRQLALAAARRDGEVVVWHAYLLAGSHAWLQYTVSCFRDSENDFRAMVGRANRWVHWQSMLRFKAMGLRCYDWGGLFADESAPGNAGINRFKREFGGSELRSYDCTVPLTVRGRLYLPLRNTWRRLRAGTPAVEAAGCSSAA